MLLCHVGVKIPCGFPHLTRSVCPPRAARCSGLSPSPPSPSRAQPYVHRVCVSDRRPSEDATWIGASPDCRGGGGRHRSQQPPPHHYSLVLLVCIHLFKNTKTSTCNACNAYLVAILSMSKMWLYINEVELRKRHCQPSNDGWDIRFPLILTGHCEPLT